MLVLRELLGFSFVELLRQSLAHFQDSLIVLRALIEFSFVGLLRKYLLCAFRILSFDFYVTTARNFRIPSHWIFMLESRACLGFSFIRLLCYILVSRALLGFLSCDCYISISSILRFFFLQIVTLEPGAYLGFRKSVMKNLQSKEIVS